jgi:hypothetical protein
MFVIETLPLAEIFHIAVRSLSMSHNAFNIAKGFQFLLFALLFQMKSLNIFSRESWCLDSRLPDLVGFDVVVDTLESPKAFKEFVRLVRVMEMRKAFPFDMEALQGLLNKERRNDSEINVPGFQTRDLQDRPLYLPLESGQVRLLFHPLLDIFG